MKSNRSNNKQLSPKDYIRKRSRLLPLYETLINSDWEDRGMATIIISRKHTSGNITFCAYLVDLFCLGLKKTIYNFNVSISEYETFKKRSSNLEIIPYDLAHNIIYSSIKFAEQYGLEPDASFTSITENFLEKNDENIPSIEIKCGDIEGRPLYINSGNDSKSRQEQILKQLDKTAGRGKYHFILTESEVENYFGFNEEEEDIEDDFIEDVGDTEDEEDLDTD